MSAVGRGRIADLALTVDLFGSRAFVPGATLYDASICGTEIVT